MIRLNNTQYFHFLQQADTLRRSGSFCDAIISVKSQTFRAHRLVLACASRTLAQQLAQGDIDSPAHCTLENFLPHIFQQVLDFTYTQTLEVSVDDLRQLLRAAQLLEMKPLEEQCRKQLDTQRANEEEDKSKESLHVKEEKDVAERADLRKRGSPALEEKFRETSSPNRATNNQTVTENVSPPATSRKKPRLSSASEKACNRDSVVTRPAASAPSLASPWTFYPNMWRSVNSLRQLVNYPNPIAYPITLSTPHMFPLLSPHFQPLSHGSVTGYPTFHPRCAQNLYGEPTETESEIKQGLLRRKRPGQRALAGMASSGELSYPEVPKSSTERAKECKYCSKSLLGDSGLRDSSTTLPAGQAECNFCGRDVTQREPQSIQQEHRGEKPYQCHHCPKKFSLKHQLDTHHRVHTGEKPFECRLCNQRSRDYSAMIKHLRTHGGASPYRCTVCLEFCSSLVAMQRHIKNHTTQDFPPNWNISSTYLYISHV